MNYIQREKKAKELVALIKMEADILQYRADFIHTVNWVKIQEEARSLAELSAKLVETINGKDE